MGACGVSDLLFLAVSLAQVGANLRVPPLHFVVHRLANVVQ